MQLRVRNMGSSATGPFSAHTRATARVHSLSTRALSGHSPHAHSPHTLSHRPSCPPKRHNPDRSMLQPLPCASHEFVKNSINSSRATARLHSLSPRALSGHSPRAHSPHTLSHRPSCSPKRNSPNRSMLQPLALQRYATTVCALQHGTSNPQSDSTCMWPSILYCLEW